VTETKISQYTAFYSETYWALELNMQILAQSM